MFIINGDIDRVDIFFNEASPKLAARIGWAVTAGPIRANPIYESRQRHSSGEHDWYSMAD